MTKTAFTCLNRQCRAEVSQPGKCDICTAMWEKTLEIARAAHGPDEDEDEDLLDDEAGFYYDDQEDFGADQGISISDPIDWYYD